MSADIEWLVSNPISSVEEEFGSLPEARKRAKAISLETDSPVRVYPMASIEYVNGKEVEY